MLFEPLRRSRNVARVAVLTVILLCLTLAASAMAWRPPTRNERKAITQAAISTAAPHKKVHVSNIHVSTVGRWASAEVTIYPLGTSTDILHKVHSKWILASNGTAGEWCVMPRKDQRNLGFRAGALCESNQMRRLLISLTGVAATSAGAKRSCRTERVQPGTSGPPRTGATSGPGIPYKIIVWRGKVSCRKARSLIKATGEGKGTWHEAPDFAAIYTSFPGGWRCAPTGTGGGYGCVRGRRIGASGYTDQVDGIQL